MKTNLFIKIINWFIRLFSKKQLNKNTTTTKHYEPEPVVKKTKGKKSRRKNNRKQKPGRKIQVIEIGSKMKFIKHQI